MLCIKKITKNPPKDRDLDTGHRTKIGKLSLEGRKFEAPDQWSPNFVTARDISKKFLSTRLHYKDIYL